MNLTVLAVGKMKEKFYIDACAEYVKRLGLYGTCKVTELAEARLSENPSPAEIEQGLAKEAEAIRAAIPKGSVLVICTPEGKQLSSEQLADRLKQWKQSGKSSFCFLIGSSNGIHPSVKQQADFKLSMSPMTFPHHLFRVMLLEQLYRAENIQSGGRYHK